MKNIMYYKIAIIITSSLLFFNYLTKQTHINPNTILKVNESRLFCVGIQTYNDGDVLFSWLEHHKSMGFEQFILYDDGSNDGSLLLIKKLQSHFRIMIKKTLNKFDQLGTNQEILKDSRDLGCDRLIILDSDEFIMGDVYQALHMKESIYIPWNNYYHYGLFPVYDLTFYDKRAVVESHSTKVLTTPISTYQYLVHDVKNLTTVLSCDLTTDHNPLKITISDTSSCKIWIKHTQFKPYYQHYSSKVQKQNPIDKNLKYKIEDYWPHISHHYGLAKINDVIPQDCENFQYLSKCDKIFLDLGMNEGIQYDRLYKHIVDSEGWTPLFDKWFGSDRSEVCYLGVEPDDSHKRLNEIKLSSWKNKRVMVCNQHVVSTNKLMKKFNQVIEPHHKNWGSRLDVSDGIDDDKPQIVREIKSINIVDVLENINSKSVTLIKMDVEGEEHKLLPFLYFSELLSKINLLNVEVHRDFNVKFKSSYSNVTFLQSKIKEMGWKTIVNIFDDG